MLITSTNLNFNLGKITDRKEPPARTFNVPFTSKPETQSVPDSALLKVYFTSSKKLKDTKSTKIKRFEALPLKEKKSLNKLAAKLLTEFKEELCSTILGKKPAAFLDGEFTRAEFDTICKHKNLLESNNIKIIARETGSPHLPCDIWFINIPEAKKVIEQNLPYFRFKLDDKNHTPQTIIESLDKPESFLRNINKNEDLVGMLLGFPPGDSIMSQLFTTLNQMSQFVEELEPEAKKHLELLNHLLRETRPDLKKEKHPELGFSTFEYAAPSKEYDHVPYPDTSFPESNYFSFTTWDQNTPTMKTINDKIPEIEKEVEEKFKTPEDLLYFLLNQA